MGIDFDERWRRRSSFESPNYHCFQGIEVSLKGLLDWAYIVSTMGTKMKGICKGFKYISQIFVVKEQEMEIGYPTDVKHVAHIGWDGQSGNAPSWMNEFKTGSAASLNNLGAPNSISVSTWSSQDFEQNIGRQPVSEIYKNSPPTDLPKAPKKHRRKKSKSTTSSPKSSSRSSRVEKSKLSFVSTTVNQVERTPNLLGVPP